MKRVLITGEHSYIGNFLKEWLSQWKNEYEVDKISVRGDGWKKQTFKGYDVVVNVAAIVHQNKNVSAKEYKRVNCELAIDLYKKCVKDGVNQYIFMSTCAVFAQSDKSHSYIKITEISKYEPSTLYGKSKRCAEIGLTKIKNKQTELSIVRAPFIYGKNSPGNYEVFAKLSRKCLIIPDYKNYRSMLYIKNLCEFLRLLIEEESGGVFYPQDREYVSSNVLMHWIRHANEKKVITINVKILITAMIQFSDAAVKVFGSFYVDQRLSDTFDHKYAIYSTADAIMEIEGGNMG